MDIKGEANSKRIAKNTLFLYLRMFFTLAVSIYTSRVILNALGVEDYGIQNAVGGFLGMLSFLNASMAGATSRFITFAIGKGDEKELKNTFSTAVFIHLLLAIFVILVAETIGLWFVENKMVIPANRMVAARWVYQCAVISSALGIMQSPYNAAIISHEKMNIFAYLEILSVSMKLGIVYLLLAINNNRLIFYSIFMLASSCLMIILYRVYCIWHFSETKFSMHIDKTLLRPMLSFSGWDLFGNMSVMVRSQGVSVLLNLFFGPLLNASAGIAAEVQGAVMGFATSVITAYRPQIIKQYATKEFDYMFTLLGEAVRISSFLLILITVPLICELHFVINLWLDQVPEFVVPICGFTLIFNFFAAISILLAAVIHATGKMKRISLYNGMIYMFVLPATYIAYKLGYDNPVFPFIINVVAVFFGVLNNFYTIKLYIPQFHLGEFIRRNYLPSLILLIVMLAITFFVSRFIEEGWLRFIISSVFTLFVMTFIGMTVFLPEQIRTTLKSKIKSKLPFFI